jgi:hypothetical protein
LIPINVPQTLNETAIQASITLYFDAGNGEVNPQNFTTGEIQILAVFG